MATHDLLVVGDLNADVIVSDPELTVEFGQVEQTVAGAGLTMGGSAAITAVGASRLGVRTALLAVVGADPLGELLLEQLRSEGVRVDLVETDPDTPTGISVILDRGDDRAILTGTGTIASLGVEQLRHVPTGVARHVHVSSYFLMNPDYRRELPHWMRAMKQGGATTSIDTNWDPERGWDLAEVLRWCDWYLPNEAELAEVTGASVIARGLEVLQEAGTDAAVKRGDRGAMARCGDEIFRITSTPAVEFVDAIGAGDSFDAGFIAGLLDGADVGTCLAMGVTAGTLSTGGVGGTTAQPTRDLLDPLVSRLAVEREPA